MKGSSDYGWTPDDFRSPSRPTPGQDIIALRWTAILSFLAALLFGLQGGWLVVVCMALTLFGVAMLVLSSIIAKEN